MKKILILVLLYLCYQSIIVGIEKRLDKHVLYLYVDKLPQFNYDGGLNNYLLANLIWLYQLDTGGEVLVSFIVQKDGSIKNIKKETGLTSPFDDEVIRVLESMPAWEPGEINSNKVDVKLYLPIEFGIKGLKEDN